MLFIVHVMLFISAVYAPWSTLGTGYAITSNYHGEDVIPSTPVTVTAGTLDQNIVQVTFRWHIGEPCYHWIDAWAVYPGDQNPANGKTKLTAVFIDSHWFHLILLLIKIAIAPLKHQRIGLARSETTLK